MNELLKVALYGAAIGLCFPLGTFAAVTLKPWHKLIAASMALGAGLLLAAALTDLAYADEEGIGLGPAIAVILMAAALFSLANRWIVRRHIKRHRFWPGLSETLLTLLVDIRRQIFGVAPRNFLRITTVLVR